MEAATKSVVEDGKGVREAARLYNVPIETLRVNGTGAVPLGCHPGPHTVLRDFTQELRTGLLLTKKMSSCIL